MISDDATPRQDDDDDNEPLPAYSQYHQEEANKHQTQADIDAAVAKDVLENPRYDEFFAPYQPQVREDFVHSYVSRRQIWTMKGESSERYLTHKREWFTKEAYGRLWDIQQKKLFDLQCQWRAEQVKVPGVEIGADFGTLSIKIENCPALTPITPDELALYLDWVRQASYADLHDTHDSRFNWHDYASVKAALTGTERIASLNSISSNPVVSPWYHFHNERTSHGQLLDLPNVRGDKEDAIIQAWREGRAKERELERAIEEATAPAVDPRPKRLSDEETEALRVDFARRFEPPKLNRQRENFELAHPPLTPEQREIESISTYLRVIDEPLPIEAHADWREAMRLAYHAYYCRKLLEALPVMYEEYCQRQEWGISHPTRHNFKHHDLTYLIRNTLLEAREWLGQPRDFNF